MGVSQFEKNLLAMRNNPAGVSFDVAVGVAKHYFGAPRINGSHHVFSFGTSFVNLQKEKGGKAKAYQVKQLLVAIDMLGK